MAYVLRMVIIQACVEKKHDDTQIGKKQWRRDTKDIYILFLQKIVTKNVY